MVSRVVSISRGSIPPRELVEPLAARAEAVDQPRKRPLGQLANGLDARLAQARPVFGPTPHSSEIASGARNAASSPGGTIVSPSGLSRSDAILAIDFVVPAPQEIVSPVSSRTRSLIQRPTSAGVAPDSTRCEMSMNASSSESGSTSGETLRKISMICCETSR